MNPPVQKIAVIGAGALGAVYGSLLFTIDRDSVFFIAAGPRGERLKAEGVTVNGRRFPIQVFAPEDAPLADLVIVAVKHRQLDDAIAGILRTVGENTVILSVMNGIDSEERLAAAYGWDKVLYALSLGIDAVREGNEVTYQNLGRILFGERDNTVQSARVRRIGELFNRAGVIHEVPQDMVRSLWFKYMINVGVNQVSAVLGMTYGAVRESARAREMMDAAMREVIAIAVAKEVDLSERDLEEWYRVLGTLGSSGKTSMLQDVEAGRPTEVDMLAGTVIAMGERYLIPTPVNREFFAALKRVEDGRERGGR